MGLKGSGLSGESEPVHYHFVVVGWGKEYIDLFLRVVLPTHLSPGNLPSVPDNAWRYRIYTPAGDAETIRRSAVYARLVRLGPVELYEIPEIDGSFKYEVISNCHSHAIQAATRVGAVLVFLAPDAIFADGAFAAMHRIARAGKQVIIAAGIRVTKETFVPAMLQAFPVQGEGAVVLPPRSLVGLALTHPHPITESLCWGARVSHAWPSHLYWRVGEEGLLAHCFHLHPLMVNVREVRLPENATIDGEYIERIVKDNRAAHVVTDSDEIAICEISSRDLTLAGTRQEPLTPRRVAEWARVLANRQHRRFFRERIRFHAGELSADWERVERESDRVVRRVEWWLRVLSILRCYDEPLKRLRRRLRPWRERWGLR